MFISGHDLRFRSQKSHPLAHPLADRERTRFLICLNRSVCHGTPVIVKKRKARAGRALPVIPSFGADATRVFRCSSVRLDMPAIVRWSSRFAPPRLCVLAFSLGSLASDSTQRRKGERDAKRIIIFWNLGSKNHKSHETKKERTSRAGASRVVSASAEA